MSTNFHTNVGSADIAAFLQFQTVSDLFQTSLGCPQISIQMYRISGYSCFPTVSDGFRPVSDLFVVRNSTGVVQSSTVVVLCSTE